MLLRNTAVHDGVSIALRYKTEGIGAEDFLPENEDIYEGIVTQNMRPTST